MRIDPDGPRLFPATRGGGRHYTKLVAAFATPFFRFLALPLIVIFLLSGERGNEAIQEGLDKANRQRQIDY